MGTPTGQISAADIRNEFGPSDNNGEKVQLGSYRVSQTVGGLSNLPMDTGIPQSGQISFGDMRNKKLNVVVNYHSGGNETRPQNARSRYIDNNVTVIGGFKGRPGESAGHKVRIHVNKTISGGSGANDCALRTGSFDTNTALQIDVGSSGKIYGRGGNGGAGGDHSGPGGDGQNGTHAIGIESNYTEVNILSGGVISCGFGGGGGGSGDHQDDKGEERHANGGGGGGGAGSPAGAGGDQGEGGAGGQDGSAGSSDHGGDGGNGGNNDNQAYGGTGGNGGGVGGGPGDGQNRDSDGGEAGSNGQAFRATGNINTFHPNNVHNSGTVRGGTSYSVTVT